MYNCPASKYQSPCYPIGPSARRLARHLLALPANFGLLYVPLNFFDQAGVFALKFDTTEDLFSGVTGSHQPPKSLVKER